MRGRRIVNRARPVPSPDGSRTLMLVITHSQCMEHPRSFRRSDHARGVPTGRRGSEHRGSAQSQSPSDGVTARDITDDDGLSAGCSRSSSAPRTGRRGGADPRSTPRHAWSLERSSDAARVGHDVPRDPRVGGRPQRQERTTSLEEAHRRCRLYRLAARVDRVDRHTALDEVPEQEEDARTRHVSQKDQASREAARVADQDARAESAAPRVRRRDRPGGRLGDPRQSVGEMRALRDEDVRLDDASPSITIRYGKPPKQPTKSGKPRVVRLLPMAVRALRAWYAFRATWCTATPHGLTFPAQRGGYRSPASSSAETTTRNGAPC